MEHFLEDGKPDTFAGKYRCHFLIYYEEFKYITDAIARAKELRKWSRDKKHQLIESMNPGWQTLNGELFDHWLPI
jgi:putative endonuclease